MSIRPAHRQFCAIAQRWQILAEQRRTHYADLYRSGRWRLYYTEQEFLLRMRDIAGICERWARIVDSAAAEIADPVAPVLHRDAA